MCVLCPPNPYHQSSYLPRLTKCRAPSHKPGPPPNHPSYPHALSKCPPPGLSQTPHVLTCLPSPNFVLSVFLPTPPSARSLALPSTLLLFPKHSAAPPPHLLTPPTSPGLFSPSSKQPPPQTRTALSLPPTLSLPPRPGGRTFSSPGGEGAGPCHLAATEQRGSGP